MRQHEVGFVCLEWLPPSTTRRHISRNGVDKVQPTTLSHEGADVTSKDTLSMRCRPG